jgi:hypothetical protein
MLKTLPPRPTTKVARQWHAEEVRARLRIGEIVARLERNALGEVLENERPMTKEQVMSAKILLAKALPDLVAIKHSGNVNVVRPDDLTDAELASIATSRSDGVAEPPAITTEPSEVH